MTRSQQAATLALSLTLSLLLSARPGVAAESVSGRYLSASGPEIRLQISVSAPPPATLIVNQSLPPQTTVEQASPMFQRHHAAQGEISWLLTDIRPGSYQLGLRVSPPIAPGQIRGELRYKDPVSGRIIEVPISR